MLDNVFPDHLVCQVFSFLDFVSLSRIENSCRLFRSLCANEKFRLWMNVTLTEATGLQSIGDVSSKRVQLDMFARDAFLANEKNLFRQLVRTPSILLIKYALPMLNSLNLHFFLFAYLCNTHSLLLLLYFDSIKGFFSNFIEYKKFN
jgi:hypothetical protein